MSLQEFRERAEQIGAPGVEKGAQELEDGLAPQAYWRAPTWKRVWSRSLLHQPVSRPLRSIAICGCSICALHVWPELKHARIRAPLNRGRPVIMAVGAPDR